MLRRTVRALSVFVTVVGTSALSGIRGDTGSLGTQRAGTDAGVVLIQVISLSGDSLYGNGVVVASGTVATERAILESARTVGVVSAEDRSVLPAQLLRVDTLSNVALLRVPGLNTNAIRVSDQSLIARDRVSVVSIMPDDMAPVSANAIVVGVESFVGVELAQLSMPSGSNVFGAPVLNEGGALVGIAFTTASDGVTEAYAIPSRYITELLTPTMATRNGRGTPTLRNRSSGSATSSVAATGTSASTRRAANVRSPTTASSRSRNATAILETTGLLNARTIQAMANGAFADLEMDREDPQFQSMMQKYLDACAIRCEATLPANRVEMTRKRCGEETTEYRYNRYGVQEQSYCSRWVTEGRGLYADPRLYSAVRALEGRAGTNMLVNAMKMAFQPNLFGNLLAVIGDERALTNDMDVLVEMNKCAGPAIKQFEDNMLQFALGKQPLWINGSVNTGMGGGAQQASEGPFVDADYAKLVDDLIVVQSKSWAMHRYTPGGVSQVEVTARDSVGRPARLLAHYTFEGLNGPAAGTVRAEFTDGLPECLYFFDAPSVCRTPNQRIVSRYAGGDYQKQK